MNAMEELAFLKPLQSISVMNSCQGCRPVPGGMRLTLRRAEDRKHFIQINCVTTVVVRVMTS
jgi:hypothetical protein